MPDYDMGTARGRIRIDYEGDGFRQTQEGFERTRESAQKADSSFRETANKIGLMVTAMAAVGPAAGVMAAAVVGAAATLGTAFGAAGAALGAFGAAVKPQFQAISDIAPLYEEAIAAIDSGSEDAKEKMQAYTDAMKSLPPATRETAAAFFGLKNEFENWSNALSSTTMPIFTRGILLLRRLLPLMTPLVMSAAGALNSFMGTIEQGMTKGRVQAFVAQLSNIASGVLPSFLNAAKNMAVGFGGIFKAFLPFSTGMAGGIESLTEKFAAWGQSLSGSEGFAAFIDNMRTNGPLLLNTLANLAQIVTNLISAFSPFLGVSLALTTAFSELVAAIPVPVLKVLVGIITAATIALKLYAATQAVITAATKAWAIAQAILNSALFANPIGLIILAIVALVAIFILAWKNSETFRRIVTGAFQAVWDFIKTAVGGIVNFVKNHWRTLVSIMLGPMGIIISLVTKYWDQIWGFISGTVNKIIGGVRMLGDRILSDIRRVGAIVGIVVGFFVRLHTGIANRIVSIIRTVASLPGRIIGYFRNAGSWLYNAGRNIIVGFINGLVSMFRQVQSTLGRLTSWIPDWKGPAEKDRRLLTKNGEMILQSLIDGFEKHFPQVQAALRVVTDNMVTTTGAALPPAAEYLPNGRLYRPEGSVTNHYQGIELEQLATHMANALNRAGVGQVSLDGRVVSEVIGRIQGRATNNQRRTR